ncbi:uncharacterized protein LOC112591959 [Melanaphis sacchari]|uniref:uncharacterized protein LOC112591959 n=1 Tax=Melanaphis sacchari TaxID=742174 RepID=UPI000DC13C51|nr:uncharacterized protein LOC112591959 [Melanaphis sacchari]
MWRKAKVVALPKPGKDYKNPKNYRPISLLCHTFKLYERMIMNRIKCQVERKLIPEQRTATRIKRWRNQRNGLSQDSILASMLFNINTNDQPIIIETKHFLYADDLALAAQDITFEIVERKLTRSLQELTNYYIKDQLRLNPDKTQICSFHLRNHEAKIKLKVE